MRRLSSPRQTLEFVRTIEKVERLWHLDPLSKEGDIGRRSTLAVVPPATPDARLEERLRFDCLA